MMILLIFLVIFCSAPFAAMLSGYYIVKSPSQFRQWFWLYVMAFAIIAYSYTPTYTNDLARYYIMIDGCKTLPFSQAFSWANDGLIVKNFLFWVVSKINEPHLIQAIAIGPLYGVTAYITYDSFRHDKKKVWVVILVQILLLPLYLANSNIRNMITFAFMFLAVYRDIVQKKYDIFTLALYILPAFVHMTGVVVFGARFAVLLFKKHYKLMLTSTLAIPLVALSLYPLVRNITFTGNIGLILKRAIWKAYTGVLSNSMYAETMQNSGYVNACRVVMFIVCSSFIIMTWRNLSRNKGVLTERHEFMIFNALFCYITCIWILLGAVKFWVFGVASVIGSGVILACYFEEKEHLFVDSFLFKSIYLMGLSRALLEIYYISQRINLGEYIVTLMTTNIWTILIHILWELFKG